MLGGKLCAHISPYRMLPLTHGRDPRSTLQRPGLPAEASSWCAPAQTLSSPLMRARPVLADYGVQLREGCCSAGACRSGAHGSRRVFRSRDISAISRWGSLLSCRTAHAIARDCEMLRQGSWARSARARAEVSENVRLVVRFGRRKEHGRLQTCHGSS